MPDPWTSSEWLSEATAWIRERADVAGDIEQPHVRWWSTVLRVPTTDGDLYFKAVSAIHLFEAALTGLLAELQRAGCQTLSRWTPSAAGC